MMRDGVFYRYGGYFKRGCLWVWGRLQEGGLVGVLFGFSCLFFLIAAMGACMEGSITRTVFSVACAAWAGFMAIQVVER